MIVRDKSIDQGTHDLRPGWKSAIQSAQAVAARSKGSCIVSFRILVNAKGHATCWTTPELTTIEPGGRSDLLIDFLCGETLDNSR